MPRGALVLVMHSCEMPQGNYWGKQTGLAAINTLSRLDLLGVVEYPGFAGKDTWVHPLSEVGNKVAVTRAMNALTFGDAQTFEGRTESVSGQGDAAGLERSFGRRGVATGRGRRQPLDAREWDAVEHQLADPTRIVDGA